MGGRVSKQHAIRNTIGVVEGRALSKAREIKMEKESKQALRERGCLYQNPRTGERCGMSVVQPKQYCKQHL